jgi:GNAT superfamily N-acetyltransferase
MPEQRRDALEVWRPAIIARRISPSSARVARVQDKLADPSACLVIGARVRAHRRDGTRRGPPRTGRDRGNHAGAGHISVVFVAPDRWGRGMGAQLVGALHREARAREWLRLTLWTRATNQGARRLYVRSGYRTTRRTQRLPDGDEIIQYEFLLDEIPVSAKPSSRV